MRFASLILAVPLAACVTNTPAPATPAPAPVAADPIQPADPVQPADPAQPAAPAQPADPAQPPDAATPSASPVLASLERTACYGTCPIYKVVVHADGTVEYHGTRFVLVTGDRTATLTSDQLAALRQAFAQAGFAGLKDDYTHVDATDAPSAILRFGDKTVRHYHGDTKAPAALRQLEDRFDQIVGTDRWIGTPDQRAHMPRR